MFFRFVIYVGWPSATRGVSQTWWRVKEGSEKSWDTPFFSSASWENLPPKTKRVWYNINYLANFLTVGGWVTGTKVFFTRGLGQIWQEVKERWKQKLGFSLYKLGASWNLFVLIWQFHNFFSHDVGSWDLGRCFFQKRPFVACLEYPPYLSLSNWENWWQKFKHWSPTVNKWLDIIVTLGFPLY